MAEKKFTNLRKRLDQLGYRQPLGIESVPLVEKLFGDLVHTTESLKKAKVKLSSTEKTAVVYDDQSEPYKNDNAKLVRETNELHQELIKIKDELDSHGRDSKAAIRKLENENSDLKFLNSQYVHKVRALEKESKQKSDRIQDLQDKNLHAVVETPGGRKKQIPFRRQRMDIGGLLPPSDKSMTASERTTTSSAEPEDPYIADLLKVADERVEDAESTLEFVKDEKEAVERRNKSLKKQVEYRDKEINRLNELLQGGRPLDAVIADSKRGSTDRVVAHLNIQVDYLQKSNKELQEHLSQANEQSKESTVAIRSLQSRNDELCTELAALEKAYQVVQRTKELEDGELGRKLVELRGEVEEKHEGIIDLQAELHKVRKERDGLIEETEHLSQKAKDAKGDRNQLAELFERADKDKRKLLEKYNKLIIAERELVMDFERLKISKGIIPKKTKTPDHMAFLIHNLEDDRDYFKKECDMLQEMLSKRLSKVDLKTQSTDEKNPEKSDAVAKLLKEERDFYKRECELLRTQQTVGGSRSPPTKDKPSKKDSSEVSRLRRERDELQSILEKFEKHLTEIQENVRSMTADKENLQLLYEQSTDEIRRLRRQQAAIKGSSQSQKVTSILEKAEQERDEALAELRRTRIDIQNLKSEVQRTQENNRLAQHQGDRKVGDLEELLTKLERDNTDMKAQLSSRQDLVNSLEEQLASLKLSLQNSNENLSAKEEEVSKLRLLVEQGDRSTADLRKRLEQKITDAQEQHNEKMTVEEKYDAAQLKIDECTSEMIRLRGVGTALDKERDALQQQLDIKTEDVVRLNKDITEKEKTISEMRIVVEELKDRLSVREQEVGSRERELKGLQRQLHSLEEEIANTARSREVTIKENKRIQDDLATMTSENQSVHKDLRDALEVERHLKEQVEEYANQVARVEDLLAMKEQEKDELLLQYQSLSSKADVLESNVQATAGEATSYRQEIIHIEQERNRLEEKCAVLEAEVEEYINAQKNLESHIENISQQHHKTEDLLVVANKEKETILGDLFAVRELCVKLDQTRDELTKKIASKTADFDKLEHNYEELKIETDRLRMQVNHEQETVKSLENVITAGREKQFHETRTHEESVAELRQLHIDFERCEKERLRKDTEATTLRKQNMTLQDEVTSLKKQVTTEKYERERLNQELRRFASARVKETHTIETGRRTATDVNSRSFLTHDLETTSRNIAPEVRRTPPSSPVRSLVNNNSVYSPLEVSYSDSEGGS